MLVQICSVLLLPLIAAERANPVPNNALESSNLVLYNQLKAVPADEWAMHDWVPQKNRLYNDRGLPVGNGELEEMRALRRMRKKQHQRGKQRGRKSHKRPKKTDKLNQHRPHKKSKKDYNHVDFLKHHILINRKHMTQNNQAEKAKREKRIRQRHGKDKKRVGKVRKHHDTRRSGIFPKDLHMSEQAKLKFQNSDICSRAAKSQSNYFLLPWWQYYCNKYEDKKERNNFHGPVYMPVYRQILDNLQTYKKLMEERKRVTAIMLNIKNK